MILDGTIQSVLTPHRVTVRICADDANFHFLLAHNRSIVIQAPSVQSFEPEEPIEESLEMRRETERELSRRDDEQLGHIVSELCGVAVTFVR